MGIPGPSVGRRSFNYVYDSSVIAWIPETQPGSGGAGGSTVVTVSTGSVAINGNSTVVQGTSPWTIAGNSTVVLTPPSAVKTGRVTVATVGTRVALSGSTSGIVSVAVQAISSNAGVVYVGSSGVAAANGYQLQPGQAVSLDIADLNLVYIDAASSGDGVTYLGVA